MKRSRLSPIVPFALICVLALGHILWLSFICDDAFISFRYARNLVEGNGLVFNVGERVEGYTNFLWVLICAMIIDAGGAPEVWTLWIGGACALMTLAAVMGYQWRRGRDFVLIGILLAANGGVAAWATGGLETLLFTLLVTLGFLGLASHFDPDPYAREKRALDQAQSLKGSKWLRLSAGFLVLAALTRPEGVLITALCGGFLLLQHVRGRLGFRALLVWAVIWVASYGVYFLWRYQYYGYLFPNTFYAKSVGPVLLPVGLEYLLYAAQRFHLYILLIPGVVLLVARRSWGMRRDATLLTGVVVFPYLAYVAYVGGDFMDMFRFIVPVIPISLFAVGQSWHAFFEYADSQWSRTSAIAAVTLLLAATVGLSAYTSWDSQRIWYRHGLDSVGLLRRYSVDWTLAAHHIARMTRPTDSLATTAAGIIPYYTNLHTIDQLGLISPDLDQFFVRKARRPGHMLLAKGEYLFQLKPQIIIGHPKVVSSMDEVRASPYIEEDWYDELTEQYEKIVAVITESPPRYMAFALRKDFPLDADTLSP